MGTNKTRSFFIKGKIGMEIWQLIFLVLAILLLVFALAWMSGLNGHLKKEIKYMQHIHCVAHRAALGVKDLCC